jgi:hypothetical protein
MGRFITICVAVLLGAASTAPGAMIYLSVSVDKTTYEVGDTVSWSALAWASTGDNVGIALLGVKLTESEEETMSPALTTGTGSSKELLDSAFGVAQSYTLTSAGVVSSSKPGLLTDIGVLQLPTQKLLNQANDGQPHLFAKGSFTATVVGDHTLSAEKTGASYYPDTTHNAVSFEQVSSTPATFTVTPEPASLLLLVAGGLVLAARRRLRG